MTTVLLPTQQFRAPSYWENRHLPRQWPPRPVQPASSSPELRTVQPCHPAREKSSALHLFLQSYRNYSLRWNSLGNCVDNCPVQMAAKNATFKVHSQKLYVIMVSSKYLGKLTLDSSIYSCWKRKNYSQVHIFKLLQMHLFSNTTLPVVFRQLNPSFDWFKISSSPPLLFLFFFFFLGNTNHQKLISVRVTLTDLIEKKKLF